MTGKNRDQTLAMGTEPIAGLMIRFSLPAIVGMLANALYNIVDRIFVGQAVGPEAIGAISVAFPYMLFVFSCGLLVGVGSGALVSISLGEGRRSRAERAMGNALLFLAAGSAVLTCGGLSFPHAILRLSGASASMLPSAEEYFRIVAWGIPFSTLSFGLNFFIRSEGAPWYAMFTLVIGAFSNIILDWFLIISMKMGISGAAWATVASQILSSLWAVRYYLLGRGSLRLRKRHLFPDRIVLGRILSVGFAPFLTELSFTVIMALFNRILGKYGGDMAISAMGIFFSLDSLFFLPVLGLAGGVQPIIGYNYGSGNFSRVMKAVTTALWMSAVYFAASFSIIMAIPVPLVKIFNSSSAQLVSLAARALRIAYSGVIFASVSVIAAHAFQAMGKAKVGIFLTLSRHFLFILVPLFLLPPLLGTDGVWMALPLSDLGGGILGAWLLKREFRILGGKIMEG